MNDWSLKLLLEPEIHYKIIIQCVYTADDWAGTTEAYFYVKLNRLCDMISEFKVHPKSLFFIYEILVCLFFFYSFRLLSPFTSFYLISLFRSHISAKVFYLITISIVFISTVTLAIAISHRKNSRKLLNKCHQRKIFISIIITIKLQANETTLRSLWVSTEADYMLRCNIY